MADSIVIVSAARTPIGGMLGDFASLQAYQLGSVAIQGTTVPGLFAFGASVKTESSRRSRFQTFVPWARKCSRPCPSTVLSTRASS